MKRTLALLIVLGLLLAVVGTAQAQNWVILWWADGGSFTIPEGETAELAIGWKTCNGGLTKAFMTATQIEITIDGELAYHVADKHDPYWDIWPSTPEDDCIPNANSKPSMAVWFYPLDLPAGEYEVSYAVWTDHQLTDGFYDPITGTPAFYDFVSEGTFTLIFE